MNAVRTAVAPATGYRPLRWHRDHRVGLAGIVGAVGLCVIVGGLGPSVITITVGPRRDLLPPWYLPKGILDPNEWLVSLMIWAAIAVGAVGLRIAMRALDDGWRPRVRRLIWLGVGLITATILVPPLTSADVLMYAAYGRLQVIGRNPYEVTPADIFRGQYDPVMHWTERPWTDTPSVYGPITSWTQVAANKLGGTNMHDIVFWLQLFSAVPFVLACLGVLFIARSAEPERQARAALMTIANPVLIWAVVAGAHNEALSVVFAVAGMIVIRKSPFLAGLAVGVGGCAKISIGIWGIAMLWAYRHEPKQLLKICLGAAIPMVAAYGLWQPAALHQAIRNGGIISTGGWVNLLFSLLVSIFGHSPAKIVVGVLSYVLLPMIVYMLSKVLPWDPAPGIAPGVDSRKDPMTIALRTAMIIGFAWVTTSIYTLSWYDLQVWMPVALLTAGKLDRLLVIRGAVLSASFVPGRAIPFGPALTWAAARVRAPISPIVQMLILAAVFLWWKWPQRPQLWMVWRSPSGVDGDDQGPGVGDPQITPAADADPASKVAAS
ncbi:hypothetical protein GCM10011575_36760 [Microlunatus endophyticus]|uniref:Alpha-1,6-mannosyltransferase n=1 Tax=Microlunatus endophyticus TaxID=1716077 RepID=A0A917W815_9ACTN|nr:hypothetical protein [Microlunatus endophyticus]GGL75242.1 hypothetical protein GCM10011575_36760 [Microlunatus endophyticus]